MTTTVALLVPAAGVGARMGGLSKPFLELGGRSVLEWALSPFLARTDVAEVVVALGAEAVAWDPGRLDPRVRTARGGSSRFGSVANALERLETDASIVAVHDGARPFPPPEAVDACIRLATAGVGAVAGVPAVDTIKRVGDRQVIEGTPPRTELWYAQTPQVFPRDLFERAVAHARAGGTAPTDDASMVERLGAEVRMVESAATNLKITRPEDVVTAEMLIARGFV
ncbi:MAG: 2-C-methyl-D-erythritol 4-phosphate cytidylyltransferase [Gemmatimonadota bacterium]|nr:2-C-methyl-D-erythritol 4-phosphate cytidylyltransferase [Gemmatimonadota bacterium]